MSFLWEMVELFLVTVSSDEPLPQLLSHQQLGLVITLELSTASPCVQQGGGTEVQGCLCRNDYDKHIFRMQKQGSRGTWDNVKKSVMLHPFSAAQIHLHQPRLCC